MPVPGTHAGYFLCLLTAALLMPSNAYLTQKTVASSQAPTTGSSADAPITVKDQETAEHLKAESPIVHIRADQVERDWPYQTVFDFNAIVSDKGEVVHADFIPGTLGEPHLQVVKQAEERIRKYQFVPFVRDGQPVFARLTIGVRILPPEKLPDEHVLFPELKDRKTMVITLSRFRCLGYCPEYRIQIYGDGKVEYVGQCAVEVVGHHSSHISRKEVDGLFAQFRQTDYFSLDDRYQVIAFDLPRYETSIVFDGQRKSVTDVDGQEVGMPDAVVRLENAMDRAANSKQWLVGKSPTWLDAAKRHPCQ